MSKYITELTKTSQKTEKKIVIHKPIGCEYL